MNSTGHVKVPEHSITASSPVGAFAERRVLLTGTQYNKDVEGVYVRHSSTLNHRDVFVHHARKAFMAYCGGVLSVLKLNSGGNLNAALECDAASVRLQAKNSGVDAILHSELQATYGWVEMHGAQVKSSGNASVVLMGTFETASLAL